MDGKSGAVCVSARFILLVACMVLVVGRGEAATEPAGAPSVSDDCTSTFTSLVDCLSYVQNGSKVEKPEGSCCSGLKKVLKTQVSCLCEAFKNIGNLGLPVNITKALSLPAACGASVPSVSNCKIPGLGTSPGPAPHSSSRPSPAAPAPATSSSTPAGVGIQGAPAPAPATAAAPAFFMRSMALLLAGLAISVCLPL